MSTNWGVDGAQVPPRRLRRRRPTRSARHAAPRPVPVPLPASSAPSARGAGSATHDAPRKTEPFAAPMVMSRGERLLAGLRLYGYGARIAASHLLATLFD